MKYMCKNAVVCKMVAVVLSVSFCNILVAADFSKKSEADLINLSGKVKVSDFADYQLEISKRLKNKNEKDAQDFRQKLKVQYEKATENMTVKQLREYQKATKEEMNKRIQSMSVKEFKESGLYSHKYLGTKCKKDKHKSK